MPDEPVVQPKRRKTDQALATQRMVRIAGTWLMLVVFGYCVATKLMGPFPGVPQAVTVCCALVNTTAGVPALPGVAP